MPRHKYGAGSVYRRGKTYWVSFYVNGEHVCESAKTKDKAEAKRLLQKHLGEVAEGRFLGPRVDRITFDELAEDVLNDYRINGRKMKDIEHSIGINGDGKRSALRKVFGGRAAQSITAGDVAAYSRQRLDNGLANGTINRELAALKRAFNLGLQREKIIRKPHIAMLEENNVRKGFFLWQDFVGVRDLLPDYLAPVMSFAYLTGWRVPSEVLRLCWHNIDFTAETVRLEPGTTKNKDGRVIYMSDEMRDLLEKQRDATLAFQRQTGQIVPLVFHNQGKPIVNYSKAWRKACQKVGQSGKIPHDFRRTAVRNMVREGIPERVVMQMTGHKTRSIFDRYHIVSDSDLKEAAKRLSKAKLATKIATVRPLGALTSDISS